MHVCGQPFEPSSVQIHELFITMETNKIQFKWSSTHVCSDI